ncbi:DUF2993 domain-containing protein [Microbacterium pumilum]|uniref:DUF2993 domain-containing protein n=1 Tax=Microbacterium pumilum TaxID=344165 RepID=A0ABP5DSZ2_9MICO
MSAGDTQPTQPIPGEWAIAEAPAPRRRHRVWPWIVGFVIVIGLAVVAWFAAEALAKNLVTKTIRDEVVTQLSLPADQDVDVEVAGAVIPQLIAGSFGEITVASDDVVVDSFSGDVVVTATDVPIRGGELGGATATVTLDEDQVRQLMSTVDGFPADSLGFAAPDLTMQTELSLFGIAVPVGVSLTPSAVDGQLVLSPSSLQVAGATVTASGLQQQFGAVADAVLRDWPVCLAQYIPAGMTLTDVAVDGDVLVADFDIDGGIISDPALQATGTCG